MIPRTLQFITILLLAFTGLFSTASAMTELSIRASSGDELHIERYQAKGNHLVLWIAPEYGTRGAHRSLAKMLVEQKIEVWLTDLIESLFLTRGSASMKKLDGNHVADLVEKAHQQTGKKIIIASDSYGSLAALMGAHQWQKRQIKQRYLSGVILFSPYTYASIPPLGKLPEYMPIIESNNVPLMIYQAANNGNFGQFENLIEKLQQHGAPVYSRITPKEMSLFYEDEPDKERDAQVRPLPRNMQKMIAVLERHPVPLQPVKLKPLNEVKSGIDIYLKKYAGTTSALPINLLDVLGNRVIKQDYRGKITLINFWATWCPPCVEEIPSFNRLMQKMQGKDFELISINYAEDNQTIIDFMKQVNVEFPVLMDPNGEFAKKWNVIAYPSTFVINKKGEIVYGVNAAIEWDSPELIAKLEELL